MAENEFGFFFYLRSLSCSNTYIPQDLLPLPRGNLKSSTEMQYLQMYNNIWTTTDLHTKKKLTGGGGGGGGAAAELPPWNPPGFSHWDSVKEKQKWSILYGAGRVITSKV